MYDTSFTSDRFSYFLLFSSMKFTPSDPFPSLVLSSHQSSLGTLVHPLLVRPSNLSLRTEVRLTQSLRHSAGHTNLGVSGLETS